MPIAKRQERVEIQWIVKTASGDERGRVVQLNEIPAGTLALLGRRRGRRRDRGLKRREQRHPAPIRARPERDPAIRELISLCPGSSRRDVWLYFPAARSTGLWSNCRRTSVRELVQMAFKGKPPGSGAGDISKRTEELRPVLLLTAKEASEARGMRRAGLSPRILPSRWASQWTRLRRSWCKCACHGRRPLGGR